MDRTHEDFYDLSSFSHIAEGAQVEIVGALAPAWIVNFSSDMVLVRDETDEHRRLFHISQVRPMGTREAE